MARPRTATAILEAKGSYLRNPGRRQARALEPVPKPFGAAPEHLHEEEKATWSEISAKLQPGVAGASDEAAFEVLCCLVVNFRRRVRLNLPHVVGELSAM